MFCGLFSEVFSFCNSRQARSYLSELLQPRRRSASLSLSRKSLWSRLLPPRSRRLALLLALSATMAGRTLSFVNIPLSRTAARLYVTSPQYRRRHMFTGQQLTPYILDTASYLQYNQRHHYGLGKSKEGISLLYTSIQGRDDSERSPRASHLQTQCFSRVHRPHSSSSTSGSDQQRYSSVADH